MTSQRLAGKTAIVTGAARGDRAARSIMEIQRVRPKAIAGA
jgi:hypothetical protein